MKRAREESTPLYVIYFADVMICILEWLSVKQLIQLESLSKWHQTLITKTPFHMPFRPSNLSHLKLMQILKTHRLQHLDLHGTFLHNKNLKSIQCTNLNIADTFVNEKGLAHLKDHYESLIVSNHLLSYIFTYREMFIHHAIDCVSQDHYILDLRNKNIIHAVNQQGDNALIYVVKNAKHVDIKCIQFMMQYININHLNQLNHNALYYAIEQHRNDITALLIKDTTLTPFLLNKALDCGNVEAAKQLILNGVDCEEYATAYTIPPKNNPFCLAMYYQYNGIAEMILKRIQVNKNLFGLRMAIQMNHLPLFKLLLQKANPHMDPPLIMDAVTNKNKKIIKLLAPYGIDKTNVYGRNALMMASLSHDMDMVRLLVKLGANPTLTDHTYSSPFILYLRNSIHREDVLFFIHVSHLNQCDHRGVNALMICIAKLVDEDILLKMIEMTDVNIVTMDGENALRVSLEYNCQFNLIKALVEKGVNVNQSDHSYPMAINAIKCKTPVEILDYLIKEGMDFNVYDKDNKHAIVHLVLENYDYVVFEKMSKMLDIKTLKSLYSSVQLSCDRKNKQHYMEIFNKL